MRFKWPGLEAEYLKRLHPDVRLVLEELDDWSMENGIPAVMVVCIGRTEAENAAVGGVKNSWHLSNCAADLRNSHYQPNQRAAVLAWLERRCPKPGWEVLDHDVRTGQHLHVARKDYSWRNTFEKRPANA